MSSSVLNERLKRQMSKGHGILMARVPLPRPPSRHRRLWKKRCTEMHIFSFFFFFRGWHPRTPIFFEGKPLPRSLLRSSQSWFLDTTYLRASSMRLPYRCEVRHVTSVPMTFKLSFALNNSKDLKLQRTDRRTDPIAPEVLTAGDARTVYGLYPWDKRLVLSI